MSLWVATRTPRGSEAKTPLPRVVAERLRYGHDDDPRDQGIERRLERIEHAIGLIVENVMLSGVKDFTELIGEGTVVYHESPDVTEGSVADTELP